MDPSYTDQLIEDLMRLILPLCDENLRPKIEANLRACLAQHFTPAARDLIDQAAERFAPPAVSP